MDNANNNNGCLPLPDTTPSDDQKMLAELHRQRDQIERRLLEAKHKEKILASGRKDPSNNLVLKKRKGEVDISSTIIGSSKSEAKPNVRTSKSERSRNQRMLGILSGTLQQAKAQAAPQNSNRLKVEKEIEDSQYKKSQEMYEHEKKKVEVKIEENSKSLEKILQDQTKIESRLNEIYMKRHNAFLEGWKKTQTKPALYYRPNDPKTKLKTNLSLQRSQQSDSASDSESDLENSHEERQSEMRKKGESQNVKDPSSPSSKEVQKSTDENQKKTRGEDASSPGQNDPVSPTAGSAEQQDD